MKNLTRCPRLEPRQAFAKSLADQPLMPRGTRHTKPDDDTLRIIITGLMADG